MWQDWSRRHERNSLSCVDLSMQAGKPPKGGQRNLHLPGTHATKLTGTDVTGISAIEPAFVTKDLGTHRSDGRLREERKRLGNGDWGDPGVCWQADIFHVEHSRRSGIGTKEMFLRIKGLDSFRYRNEPFAQRVDIRASHVCRGVRNRSRHLVRSGQNRICRCACCLNL